MVRVSAIAFVAATLLVCGPVLRAQFVGGARSDARSVSALVDRVHDDLDHAYRLKHFSNDDRERLNHAEKELREFSQTWDKGKFDVGRLDDAIGRVQHVLDDNKLPKDTRSSISNDVTQLHRMREAYENHEIGL